MEKTLEILEVENRGRIGVVRLRGSLDVRTTPVLLRRATEIQSNGQHLVLNLSGVTFIGSSGIGALLVLVEQFGEQAGKVRFACPSPAVRSVIELLNLDRFLAIDPTEKDSFAALEP